MALKDKTFRDYIQRVYDQVGTDKQIGVFLGFTDGSRVGLWRKGEGRPDELNVIKLARWMGDDPIEVLRLAGYAEMADLIKGVAGPAPIPFSVLRPHLVGLLGAVESMITMMDTVEKGGRK